MTSVTSSRIGPHAKDKREAQGKNMAEVEVVNVD